MQVQAAGFWAVLSLAFHMTLVQSAENVNCHVLETVFPSCPCRAADEEIGSVYSIVDCSNLSLNAVPIMKGAYDKVIYKLSLKNNLITALTNDSLQGLKIQYLDLSDNPLSSVENGAFLSTSDSLQTLEIDGNRAGAPPSTALQVLTKLSTLVMRKYQAPVLEEAVMSFLPFTYLKSLTLDVWDTRAIEHDVFMGLANSLQSLSLLNMNLINLPLDLLAEHPLLKLETMVISNTKIKSVTHSAFKELQSLKHLDLSHNVIEELEDNCFLGVEDTLEILNLQMNELVDKLGGLAKLGQLRHLDLSQNTFSQIPPMAQLGTTKPLTLLLNDNQISLVPSNAFNGYAQHLSKLDLTKNYIRAMDTNSFAEVTQLSTLYLHNQLGADSSPIILPYSLTNSASAIETMDLSGQKVDATTMWAVVKELTAIKWLNLNSIELKGIPDASFQNANSLKYLDLGINSLSVISQSSLMGLRNLESLNLKGTDLKTIPSCLFHGFESQKISVDLSENPIKCDCNLKQFLEDVKKGSIELSADSNCVDNRAISSIDPDDLGCSTDQQGDTCIEFYTTTPAATNAPATEEPTPPDLTLTLRGVTSNSLFATWIITDNKHVARYQLRATKTSDINSQPLFSNTNIADSESTLEVKQLPEGTSINVCVTAVFTNEFQPIVSCKDTKTKVNGTDPGTAGLNNDDSSDTAIIVGCVVAGVALIGVLTAIIILLVLRKRPKDMRDSPNPTQPRHFAKAELPSMTEDSRSFKKVQKKGSSPEPKGMQVVAISDGQTSPSARVGRANMMFQDEDGYEPMKNFKKLNGGSMYENDHGSLPPTPGRDSIPPSYPAGAYYNQGFQEDKYDQIEIEL